MKNSKLFIIAFIVASIIAMQTASAGVGMQNYPRLFDSSNITRDYGYIQYGSSVNRQPNVPCFYTFCFDHMIDESDFIPAGQPLQAYILYGLDPIADWNVLNPNSTIDYCSILVKETHKINLKDGSNSYSNYTLNKTFTASDEFTTKDMFRHFIFLQRGDYAEVFFDCHFTGQNQTILTPASFSIVVPTKNCLACQFYNNAVTEFDDIVSDAIQDLTNQMSAHIKSFMLLNVELGGILYWVLLTFLVISVIGGAFLILYYIYLFIKTLIRSVG